MCGRLRFCWGQGISRARTHTVSNPGVTNATLAPHPSTEMDSVHASVDTVVRGLESEEGTACELQLTESTARTRHRHLLGWGSRSPLMCVSREGRGLGYPEGAVVTSGVAEFIMQEEFDRYTGT